MTSTKTDRNSYHGYEQGPIRPPSEARSLLVRVTRNCPWNRCTFCPVYKGTRFSTRPVDHVLRDLDTIAARIDKLSLHSSATGILVEGDVREMLRGLRPEETEPFHAALSWYLAGMESVFLQDADSLVLHPNKLIVILNHLKTLFPSVKRITSYSRSDTINRLNLGDLRAVREAGLNRIHIGMESGSDAVLAKVCKGATKEIHISAGLKVKEADIELSEYYMPGLGGCDLYHKNALETADAMNRINPHFIRLRTLAIPSRAPLFKEVLAGRFKKCPDLLAAAEILLFIENLADITSYLASDHVLNLFPEIEGQLPESKNWMVSLLRDFLAMDRKTRYLYQFGRRSGIFSRLGDLHDPARVAEAVAEAERLGVTEETIDDITDSIVQKFI